ncbi:HYC_CC_PP family protein [Capnocytophaga catalasegens]|uniref:Uncharacterized protein n=1 Tax=Capnocytophaga catalasegens TaxID=1004260 RepID=A0AAV5AX90_9FLAO|nr:hypothetical protein [Capnocytophaga catalasegens]GIZ14322.1 hypothetical protein RCZ03_03230 [Capnocytophaga catalasegens]GJM51319.1 hypothetical protein RCZ15_22920 [Capnocytophaga catalasegens]GJM53264.1 hypothetical protein RCZ16_15810 [Capnocytophaga catalasegens]
MKRLSIIHQVSAILLSLLILTSSVGVSIDLHFCENQLNSISFSSKSEVDNCEMNQASSKKCCQASNTSTQITLTKHSDCCATTTISSQSIPNALVEVSYDVKKVEKSYQTIIKKTSYFQQNKIVITRKEVSFLNYSSMLLTKDIVILAEQFLC